MLDNEIPQGPFPNKKKVNNCRYKILVFQQCGPADKRFSIILSRLADCFQEYFKCKVDDLMLGRQDNGNGKQVICFLATKPANCPLSSLLCVTSNDLLLYGEIPVIKHYTWWLK